MSTIQRVRTTDRQDNIPAGVNNNIFVRAFEFNPLVDRVNTITTEDNTLSVSSTATAAGFVATGGEGLTSDVSNGIAPFIIAAAQNNITAGTGGAISVANFYTTINTDAGGDAFTLADGTIIGQLKKIQLIVDGGGNAVITPANLSGGTTITMADAADFCLLIWNGTDWVAIELGNDADGVTAPVIA